MFLASWRSQQAQIVPDWVPPKCHWALLPLLFVLLRSIRLPISKAQLKPSWAAVAIALSWFVYFLISTLQVVLIYTANRIGTITWLAQWFDGKVLNLITTLWIITLSAIAPMTNNKSWPPGKSGFEEASMRRSFQTISAGIMPNKTELPKAPA